MPTYTIEQITGTEEWQGNDGTTMVTFEALLAGDGAPSRTLKLYKPKTAQPYAEGDTVDGTINEGKFKKESSWGGSGGADGGKFDRRPEHPSNERRMRHSTAISSTTGFIDQMLTLSVIPQPKDKDEYTNLAEGVITWIESTYADGDA